ncbi:Hcp family type VI secretion system effector [Roseibium litorale]|uniref:Type VI secretion system tube protein Hcp n=1 Tax=Roseibium litorale TaxID=2803841 RepID=A0ABR9CLW6_9HYPH|nr:type VI secretion system tube protein Hcp [Roseibium litorale]MBD8891297.1 type VI secretion system tube protein Hcp [Roseibium litorale]
MAFDAFLYFPGQNLVVGETTDSEMSKNNAFELRHFDFGAETNVNIGSDTSGAGAAGKTTFKDFTIKKRTDTASCGLFHTLCTGNHFKEAIIELRRSGGASDKSGKTFMKFHFKMVMVKDMSWSGDEGDDILEEDIIFEYGAIKVEYHKQSPDGKLTKASGGQGEAKWSRVLNSASYEVNR